MSSYQSLNHLQETSRKTSVNDLEQPRLGLLNDNYENRSGSVQTDSCVSTAMSAHKLRQFWMEDAACNKCMNCWLPFSVFRRKHHCRSCGAIFCDNCSSKTAELFKSKKPVRVCNNCFGSITKVENEMNENLQDNMKRFASGANNALDITVNDHNKSSVQENINSYVSLPSHTKSSYASGVLSGVRKGTKESASNVGNHFGQLACSNECIDLLDAIAEFETGRQLPILNPHMSNSIFCDGSLSSRIINSREKKCRKRSRSMILNAKDTLDYSYSSLEDNYLFQQKELMNEFVSDSEKVFESERTHSIELLDRSRRIFLELRRVQILDRLLTRRINSLCCKRPGVFLSHVIAEKWKKALVEITSEFCTLVPPWKMNFETDCQVETISGGSIDDCAIINGIVCEKNVVDRMMRTCVKRPRIMLIAGALEFLEDKSGISSFDTMREQEKEYMELVVRKIEAIGVDLLLTGSGVTRLAQHSLLKANISLAINVSKPILQRISMLTGATILPRIGSISQKIDPRGTCGCWSIKQFSIALSPQQKYELFSANSDQVHDSSMRTFMFFEGCPRSLGASICLRGGCLTTLKYMKDFVWEAINSNYTVMQQNALLHNVGVGFRPSQLKSVSAMSLDDNLLSSSSISFAKVFLTSSNAMNECEFFRHMFGNTGKDLSLGEFLRKQCFEEVSKFESGKGHSDISGSVIDSATTESKAADSAPLELDLRESSAKSVDSIGAGNWYAERNSGARKDNENLDLKESKESTKTEVRGALTAVVVPEVKPAQTQALLSHPATRIITGFEDSVRNGPRNCVVYCVADSRVYVNTETLSGADSMNGTLKEILMNFRRDYVARCIRDVQERCILNSPGWGVPILQHALVTWSECTKCDAFTDFQIVSKDAESICIFRWLQLILFFDAKSIYFYIRRGKEPRCTHSILKNYIIYFECMGQVTSFCFEKAPRATTSLYTGVYNNPRRFVRFAEQWRISYSKMQKQALQIALKTIRKSFLDDELRVYQECFLVENEEIDTALVGLVDRVESSVSLYEEIIASGDDLLQQNRVYRDVLHGMRVWNDDLRRISELVEAKIDEFQIKNSSDPTTKIEGATTTAKYLSHEDKNERQSNNCSVISSMGQEEIFTEAEVENNTQKNILQAIRKRCEALRLVCSSKLLPSRGRPNMEAGFGKNVVFVFDDEPTSWIAHALNSIQHRQKILDIAEASGSLEDFQNSSWSIVLSSPLENRAAFIELKFHDPYFETNRGLNFSIQIYYPLLFYAARQAFLQRKMSNGRRLDAEIGFLESLSRCTTWKATGGKSRSSFYKTKDGSFIAKSISAGELDMLMTIAKGYFSYLGNVYSDNTPSALQRVLGVYTIKCNEAPSVNPKVSENCKGPSLISSPLDSRSPLSAMSPLDTTSHASGIAYNQGVDTRKSSTISFDAPAHQPLASEDILGTPRASSESTKTVKTHFIILDNLFPSCDDSEARFDLKGNSRNRLVENPKLGDVLMDCNFCRFTNGIPLPMTKDAKSEIRKAIENDTRFFESEGIVDYSMLIGIPHATKPQSQAPSECSGDREKCTNHCPTISLGLIDFLQQYNVKKMIESNVKRAGMIAGHPEPTVIDPTNYRSRMLLGVDRYFSAIPDNELGSDSLVVEEPKTKSQDDINLL